MFLRFIIMAVLFLAPSMANAQDIFEAVLGTGRTESGFREMVAQNENEAKVKYGGHRTYSIWIEPGITAKGRPTGALGFKFENFGMKLGVGSDFDYWSKDVDRMVEGARFLSFDVRDIGRHNVDYAYGFDFDYHVNISAAMSVYAGVGMYWQETRNLYVTDYAQSNMFVAYPKDTYFYDKQRNELKVPFEGGVQFRLPLFDEKGENRLMLGVGYHMIRGFNVAIGYAY